MNKIISDKLMDAAYDYKYLLTRGYPVKASLDLITTRYTLSKKERLLLYRCIHSTQYIEEINKKLLCFEIKSHILLIDFYNIVISTINMLRGGAVYLCDDCTSRDLRGAKLRNDDYPYLQKALKIIVQIIGILRPRSVIAIIDKNISYSIEHANMLGLELKNLEIRYSFELTPTPDSKIISYSRNSKDAVVATSDSLIMLHTPKITPLTTYTMFFLNLKPYYNFTSFNPHCSNCFDEFIKTVNKNCEYNS
jgi:hypothetical protein